MRGNYWQSGHSIIEFTADPQGPLKVFRPHTATCRARVRRTGHRFRGQTKNVHWKSTKPLISVEAALPTRSQLTSLGAAEWDPDLKFNGAHESQQGHLAASRSHPIYFGESVLRARMKRVLHFSASPFISLWWYSCWIARGELAWGSGGVWCCPWQWQQQQRWWPEIARTAHKFVQQDILQM